MLIRGASVVENMGAITTVALDKTGTLTKGYDDDLDDVSGDGCDSDGDDDSDDGDDNIVYMMIVMMIMMVC